MSDVSGFDKGITRRQWLGRTAGVAADGTRADAAPRAPFYTRRRTPTLDGDEGGNGAGGTTPPDLVKRYVRWGAGPRAGQALLLGGKARALLEGRTVVDFEDIRAVALPVLRHRVLVNFQAEADGIDADEIVRRLMP